MALGDCSHNFEHGPLHVCPEYSQEKKDEIALKIERFNKHLRDPGLNRNVPPFVLAMFKLFAGINE